MGGACLKEKKEQPPADADVNKPDPDRKYKGRKPQDDSWIEGGRRQLPVPVAPINHSSKKDSNPSEAKKYNENEMADPHHVPIKTGNNDVGEEKGTENNGNRGSTNDKQPPARSSVREIKINDIRNNLKETVKMK